MGTPGDLPPLAPVRVVRLLRSLDTYDAWHLNQRPPRVGDVGALLDRLTAQGGAEVYAVECVGSDGRPLWVSELSIEELELVTEASGAPGR